MKPRLDVAVALALNLPAAAFAADGAVVNEEQYLNGKLSPESEKLAEMYQQRHIGYGTADR